MKKIFLLSLLSVLFLSAFCQVSVGNAEVITKITIVKHIDDAEIVADGVPHGSDIEYGWWIFFYRTVTTQKLPDGTYILTCSGIGWRICFIRLRDRGESVDAVTEVMDTTCENLITESDAQIARGVFKGSVTRKIAYRDPAAGNKESYLLFQMNWDNDPEKPYNGKAEITISKTDNFGLKF